MSDEVKHKSSAQQVRAPEGTRPQPKITTPSEPSWHPMAQAPQDGSYIFLKGDTQLGREWYWYKTRQFRKGTWQAVGWWRLRFGAPLPPSFDPEGFRLASEGVPPS